MAETRPKLLLVGAQPEAVQDLLDLVGDRYELVEIDKPLAQGVVGPSRAELLLGAIGEGVGLAAHTGELIWANEFFNALEPEVRARVAGVCRESAEHIARRPSDAAGVMTCKFEVASAGERRLFDVYVTQLAESGDRPGLAVVVRDVTVTRKTQRKMDAIDRAGYELARFDVEQIRRMNSMERLQLLES
ncbi:MAG: hypothetical protein R3B49_05135, partial [Phycisphaerales bacterium]